MEINKEAILEDLNNFSKIAKETDQIPDPLEKFLIHIAKTGDTLYSWPVLKPLIKKKIELISSEFNQKFPCETQTSSSGAPMYKAYEFEEIQNVILTCIEEFYGAPFTIQRLCELLTCPYKHYKRTDKFMRALEKNVIVVSTIEPCSESEAKKKLQNKKPGNFTTSSCSSSDVHASSSSSTSASSSAYVNGTSEGDVYLNRTATQSGSSACISQPAPLQQLDSFTTVFVSSPSTPLDVVQDIQHYETKFSSSSSSNSPTSSSEYSSAEEKSESSSELVSNETTSENSKVESSELTKSENEETSTNDTTDTDSEIVNELVTSQTETEKVSESHPESVANEELILEEKLSEEEESFNENLDENLKEDVDMEENDLKLDLKREGGDTEFDSIPRKKARAQSPLAEEFVSLKADNIETTEIENVNESESTQLEKENKSEELNEEEVSVEQKDSSVTTENFVESKIELETQNEESDCKESELPEQI